MFYDAHDYFTVRPSGIPGAGEGLWAKCNVPKHALFRFGHSKPRVSDKCKQRGFDVIQFYYDEESEPDTPCIYNGKLCKIGGVFVDERARRPRYVYAPRDQPMMKANDLAWSPGTDGYTYMRRSERNKLELILAYEDGNVVGTYAMANRNIKANEEVGITYSYDYWTQP
jgi:hypothetical protein